MPPNQNPPHRNCGTQIDSIEDLLKNKIENAPATAPLINASTDFPFILTNNEKQSEFSSCFPGSSSIEQSFETFLSDSEIINNFVSQLLPDNFLATPPSEGDSNYLFSSFDMKSLMMENLETEKNMAESKRLKEKRDKFKKSSLNYYNSQKNQFLEILNNSRMLDSEIDSKKKQISQAEIDIELAKVIISDCDFPENYSEEQKFNPNWEKKYNSEKENIEFTFKYALSNDEEMKTLKKNVELCETAFNKADQDDFQRKINRGTYGSRKSRARRRLQKAKELKDLRIKDLEHAKLKMIQNSLEIYTDKIIDLLHLISANNEPMLFKIRYLIQKLSKNASEKFRT